MQKVALKVVVLLVSVLGLIFLYDYLQLKPCGIEGCHGLDFSCSENIAEVCDASYLIGDKCRQYNPCEIVDGSCKKVANEKFESCKSCVESCLEQYPKDPEKQFNCESSCE